MSEHNKLISRTMMNTLLGDAGFLAEFPQFAPIANTIKIAAAPSRAGGCSSCRKRRVEYNAFNDFLGTLRSLPPEGLAAIKRRLGASTLMFSSQNQRTGRYENGVL